MPPTSNLNQVPQPQIMRIVNQTSQSSGYHSQNAVKEKMEATKRSFNEKINAKKVQHSALMDMCTKELDELKKKEGPSRKLRKTDAFYPDYLRALEIAEEIKQLMADKKHALDEVKKSASVQ